MTMNPQDRDHTQPHTTARGFDHLRPAPSVYGGQVAVSESSAALGPHIWLDAECPADLNEPEGPSMEAVLHLTAESAWRLAEQLMTLVRDHYQGDARPDSRIADFPDENQAAELNKARQTLDVLRDRVEDAGRFSDDYIVHGTRSEQTAQAGNAVSSNVPQWIGGQLLAVF